MFHARDTRFFSFPCSATMILRSGPGPRGRAAAEHHHRAGRRHGLVGPGLLRRRDSHAASGFPGEEWFALSPVLQQCGLRAFAGLAAHRALLPAGRTQRQKLERSDQPAQVRHHRRTVAEAGISDLDDRQMARAAAAGQAGLRPLFRHHVAGNHQLLQRGQNQSLYSRRAALAASPATPISPTPSRSMPSAS